MSNNSRSIMAQACCRVDLAGGTLDIWPLYLFHPGALTLNFAVNIFTRCRITPLAGKKIVLKSADTRSVDRFPNFAALRESTSYQHPLAVYLVRFFAPEDGFELETFSQSPEGAGISGSSALMIATTAALARHCRRRLRKEQIRIIAQNVEAQLIGVPTGCQDYYPALYGGLSAIELRADGIHRQPIPIPAAEVDERFLLVYTGAPRQSGINNWEVFKAHIHGNKQVFRNFEEIGKIAREMHRAITQSDWAGVERLMREEWKLRKTNAPGISTPLMDDLIRVTVKNGARAAKVCGAGGGGCVVFLTAPEARDRVAKSIRNYGRGVSVLPCRIARRGLIVKTGQASSSLEL